MTVTDSSGRTATSTTLTVSVANTGPSVGWTTTNNTTVSGVFTIAASARSASTGTAWIKKWCLTVDGSPVTSRVATPDDSYSDVYSRGTFNAATGCWSGSYNLASGKFYWDSTAWADGSHTYVVTVTDSSGRTATSTTLTVTTENPQPTTRVIGLTAGTTVSGTVKVTFEVDHPGANSITSWCLSISNSACVPSGQEKRVGETSTHTVSFDTSLWHNGFYSATVTATDSIGRSIKSGPIAFYSRNLGAWVSSLTVKNGTPKWSDRSVIATVSTTNKNATSIIVYWGTSQTNLKSVSFSTTQKTVATLSCLKPKSVYYVKVKTNGPNGSSETAFTKFTSASIPGGGGVPSVLRWRLDLALSKLGCQSDYTRYGGGCGALGYENGLGHILDKRKWVVVNQIGSQLYVCWNNRSRR